jgi:ABC-2 type transport system ATP-binding protein
MSSHVLAEVERVCDRIALLRDGELVLSSPIAEVRRLSARGVRVTFRTAVTAPAIPWPDHCEALQVTPRVWHLRINGPIGSLLPMLSALPVEDIDVREPHLEDVLRRYYKNEATQ